MRTLQSRFSNHLQLGRIGTLVSIFTRLDHPLFPLERSQQRIFDDTIHPRSAVDLQQDAFETHAAGSWDAAAGAERRSPRECCRGVADRVAFSVAAGYRRRWWNRIGENDERVHGWRVKVRQGICGCGEAVERFGSVLRKMCQLSDSPASRGLQRAVQLTLLRASVPYCEARIQHRRPALLLRRTEEHPRPQCRLHSLRLFVVKVLERHHSWNSTVDQRRVQQYV